MKNTDLPICNKKEDKLGFSKSVDKISSGIKNYNEKSFVLSIEGAWGTGKTSFMNLIEN